jgi:type IV pilus assembly protein PilC
LGGVYDAEEVVVKQGPCLSNKQKVRFFNQLAKSLEAGLSISQSLSLVQASLPRSVQSRLQIHRLNQGLSLSQMLQIQPPLFDAWTLGLIEMGEYSGALAPTFAQLAVVAQAQQRHRRYLRSALFSFLAVVMGATIVLTAVLGLNTSATLILLTWVVGLSLGILLLPQGAKLRRKLPILAQLSRIQAMIQLSALALPLHCGVPLSQGLAFVIEHTHDSQLAQILHQAGRGINRGLPLSEGLRNKVPPLVLQYVRTGEETGNLDSMLGKLGEHYGQELEAFVKQLQGILRPLGVLGMGAVVLVLGMKLLGQLLQSLP